MKHVVYLTVALILLCFPTFAGGQQGKAVAPMAESVVEKTPVEIYKPGFAFPQEKINLQFWEIYSERPGWLEFAQKVAKEYSQIHPNVSVTVREVPQTAVNSVFLAALEAKTMPDVFCLFMKYIHPWGAAAPAPDWVVKLMKEKYTDDALQWMLYTGSREEYKGKYLGWISVELDPGEMLYYNKTMLKESGVSVPKLSPELVNAMKKTTKYDATGNIEIGGWGIRYSGSPGGIDGKWGTFMHWWRPCQKGRLFNDDWSDVADWEGEDYYNGAKLYHDMVWKWKVASNSMPAPAEAFKLGLVAMTNRESFLYGVIKRDNPDLDFGIAPIVNGSPPFGQYEVGASFPSQLACVSKTTKYPNVAWDFNMFFNNDEHDLQLCKLTGSYPRRKANVDSEYVNNLLWKDVYKEMTTRPTYREESLDPYGAYSELHSLLGSTIEQVLSDKNADIRGILKKAKADGRKILREYMEKKAAATE